MGSADAVDRIPDLPSLKHPQAYPETLIEMPPAMPKKAVFSLALACSAAIASSATYDSAGSGTWNAANPGTFSPAGNPQPGAGDVVNILTGHTVIWDQGGVGLPGSGDFGIANDGIININGGVLSQVPTFFWVRIGQQSTGTLNINDGRFHFASVQSTDAPNLQIGIQGGTGIVNIGDGVGDPGSAILNLRDLVDGTQGNARISLNLASDEGGGASAGLLGKIVINSDGLLEGGKNTTRIGQAGTASHAQSSVTVNAGGQWRVHETLEIGSGANDTGRSNGLISLTGTDSTSGTGGRIDQDRGEFVIGWNGDAQLDINNGGTYSKVNTPGARGDIFVGREQSGIGIVNIGNGGQFLRGAGGEVADLRIGWNGTGTMNINDGGLVENQSGNWDWIGENNGSHGLLNVNAGGIFRTVGQTNFNIGVNTGANGVVVVNGGTLDLQSTTGGAEMRIGENGDGTFRQFDGTTNVQAVIGAKSNGSATIDIQGGTFNVRGPFFLGGDSNAATGTGTVTVTQSGGTFNAGGSFVLGLGPGHTVNYAMTGGIINNSGSDMSVGESGIGSFTIGENATVNNTSGGAIFVGRNEGSSGTLIVDGNLSKTAGLALRVGNGNSDGIDNTTAPGLLGGTGFITSAGGVNIGAHGTLTGGTLATVGELSITGNLAFSAASSLYANFNPAGNVDRIDLFGSVDINGGLLSGSWVSGGAVGVNSRYWLLVNDGFDSINGTFANTTETSPFGDLFPDADAWVNISGQEFAVYYDADFDTNELFGGNDLLLSPVPEPSISGVLLVGALGLSMTRRRRRA